MDTWTRIRRDVLVEKMSRREACRKYNLNFRTIQKILKHPEPPEKPKEYARAKPKFGPFISVIHEILEADKKVHPKQRHTGKRIFDRLREEHGYTGGITVVRDEIRRFKQQTAEVFMPLEVAPSDRNSADGRILGVVASMALGLYRIDVAAGCGPAAHWRSWTDDSSFPHCGLD